MSYDDDVTHGQSYPNSRHGHGPRSDGNWQQVERRGGGGGGGGGRRGDY
jgi:hypothetical protein